MTHNATADLLLAIEQVKAALKATPEAKAFTFKVARETAELFLDFLQHHDPDMPPAPICELLGPLVGDVVMNRKLQRLDEIANALGPTAVQLSMLVGELQRRSQ